MILIIIYSIIYIILGIIYLGYHLQKTDQEIKSITAVICATCFVIFWIFNAITSLGRKIYIYFHSPNQHHDSINQ